MRAYDFHRERQFTETRARDWSSRRVKRALRWLRRYSNKQRRQRDRRQLRRLRHD